MDKIMQLWTKLQLALIPVVYARVDPGDPDPANPDRFSNTASVDVGFRIPSLPDIISFLIKFFFFIAGLAALIFLLLGAFSWVTSSGDKEAVKKAQDKIQAAVVGLVVIVLVLAIIVTLEQFVFNGHLCLGISCPVNFTNYVLLNNN